MKNAFVHIPGDATPSLPIRVILAVMALWLICIAGSAIAADSVEQRPASNTIAQRVAACAACHGKEGRATSEGFFPRIAGKPAGYLYNQLVNFRDGRRRSPQMTYMVAQMSDAYLMEIAQYFSQLHLPYPMPQASDASPAIFEKGRVLVMTGDASRNIPACISCHGQKLTGALPTIPSLVGLPRDYLNAQFGAWMHGSRSAPSPDCMAQTSKQLRPDDVQAITAWLSSQPVPADMTPASAIPDKLPMPCGSATTVKARP